MLPAAAKQQGVALVTALLIVAIAVVLASSLVDRLFLDIRRTENLVHSDQAYLHALGMENIARLALQYDQSFSQTSGYDDKYQIDSVNTQFLTAPVEGGIVSAQLVDLQSRFNINNLAPSNPDQAQEVARFQRLLSNLQLDPNLVFAIIDWIDPGQDVGNPAYGAEFDYYIGLQPPYRSADTLMASPSELRLVKGFEDNNTYETLIDYICALPEYTAININTASREMLNSLDQNLQSAQVEQILAQRGEQKDSKPAESGFKTRGDFEQFMKTLNIQGLSTKGTSVGSDFFLLVVNAETGIGRSNLYSIIQRDAQGNSRVISRSQGTW
jgi:general secretion pathway protein K